MASRRLVAAATSPSPLARLVSRPGLAGLAGRHWPEKVNLWEDPMNPMRWKASRGFRRFSTEVREPADKGVNGIEVKEPAGKAVSGMRMWWHRATYPIQRIKHRMGTANLQERAMARFVFLIFGVGTPAVIWVKSLTDLSRRVSRCAGLQPSWFEVLVLFIPVCRSDDFQTS